MFGENSVRLIFQRQKFCLPKIPFGENSFGENSVGESSFGENSGHGNYHTKLYPLRLGFVTLQPVAFDNIYLPPVAKEASRERILNTNELYNIKQLLNTYQKLCL